MYKMKNRIAIWKMPKNKNKMTNKEKKRLAKKKKLEAKQHKELKAYWDKLQKQQNKRNAKYNSH